MSEGEVRKVDKGAGNAGSWDKIRFVADKVNGAFTVTQLEVSG